MPQHPSDRDDRPADLAPPAAPAGSYAYPAGGAGASQVAGPGDPGPGAVTPPRTGVADPGAVSVVNFLAGIWLVLAPFALDYDTMASGFDGTWNDVVIGVAIALVAMVRMLAPWRSAAIGAINVGLGGWLVAAPFVLGYNAGADATAATWNDVIVGVIVLVVALVSVAWAIRGPRGRPGTDAT